MGKFILLTGSFRTLALAAALAAPAANQGFVTFEINSAELMKDGDGTPIPAGTGLFILAASRSGGFDNPPNAFSFLPGDEIELGRWSANSEFAGAPGILFASTGAFSLSNGLDADDQVGLYWFPTLNTGSATPGNNTPYGFYRNDAGLDGGEPWTVPQDNEHRLLRFWTSDSDFGGSNPPSASEASNFTAVPEPQTYVLIAAASLAGFATLRRWRTRFPH